MSIVTVDPQTAPVPVSTTPALQKKLYKSYLLSYRVFAFFMLYGLLIVFGGYGFTMGFYSLNRSWVVPMSIAPSNDKILAMTQSAVTTQATLNTLQTNTTNLMRTREELVIQRTTLQNLLAQLATAIKTENQGNTQGSATLSTLSNQKQEDIANTKQMLDQYETQKAGLDHDLKMGLITQVEYNNQLTSLIQFKNSFTDSQVSKVMTDLTAQKLHNASYAQVDMISKQVDLTGKIAELNLAIQTGDEQIKNNQTQVDTIRKAFDTVQHNPFYLATKADKPLTFAFVQYDNQDRVREGAPIYDCYLSMLACRQVGRIATVFHEDEEKAINPFFKTDMRGFLIELELSNPDSMKSKTLFVGAKPILF